jgi:hypothetical protein
LVLVCFFSIFSVNAADAGISVILDNRIVVFDQAPFIENSRILVPIRAIAEAANIEVEYDSATRTAKLTKIESLLRIPLNNKDPYVNGKTHTILLTIGSDSAVVDGEDRHLDVPAKIIGDRTFVPLRFISEAMDMDVIWIEQTKQVLINSRLRGSKPLTGEKLFPSISKETISLVGDNEITVTLGMDVTEVQKQLGSPIFFCV